MSDLLGIPVVGTIARNKKTLDSLMDTVYKVCNKKILPMPKKISYSHFVEKEISVLQKSIIEEYEIDSILARWISIKLIDGEEKILESIEENLSIDLQNNENIQNLLKNSLDSLSSKNIGKNSFRDSVVSSIMDKAENICSEVCVFENENYSNRDRKIDKILTSKKFGIPIMILFLMIIFWLTIIGANYPSQLLFTFFGWIQEQLISGANFIHCPAWLSDMLILGVYQTLTWVISVMLPPMAIFFPLFTFLEDLGYLPRIAFNMDGFFKKCCCTGKQMITMCMGVTKL